MSDINLYVYDLTKGMARQFSALFLGKHIDGVWHTGIVAYGLEWYFGSDGISSCPPKGTPLGEPNEIINLGRVEMSQDDFEEIIRQMSESSYAIGTYNLIEHNCNNFSNDLAQVLVGKTIPTHILDLPREILNSPAGPMLRPFLEQAADPMGKHRSGGGAGGLSSFASNKPAPSAAAKSKSSTTTTTTPSSNDKDQKIPSSVEFYKPDDLLAELTWLITRHESTLSVNDKNMLLEAKDYLSEEKASWSLGPNHLKLLMRLFVDDRETRNRLAIVKSLQKVSLNIGELAVRLASDEAFKSNILGQINQQQLELDLKLGVFRLLSNMCVHSTVSRRILENGAQQDLVCKELADYVLMEVKTDMDTLIHDAAISFFYNLVPAFHLESLLSEANALQLGCALLEHMPKFRSSKQTTYRMLALLRSCLVRSNDVRDLAQSMEFNLGSYRSSADSPADSNNNTAAAATAATAEVIELEKKDTYDSIVSNIDQLIHHQDTSDN